MPRRALRRPDPALDLTRHLKSLEQLPRRNASGPLDAEALFGRAAPLEVEVGSGKGLFLRTAALACPTRDFLGIEIARRYAEHIAASLARQAIGNARIVAGDAARLFAEFFEPGSLAAVHVYFPDPWWKKKHKKRRIMNEMFLRHVERVLAPGGALHFWTDVEEYFQSAVELVGQVTRLVGPLEVIETPAAHDFDYRTHFERRMRQHGEPVFRSRFVKN